MRDLRIRKQLDGSALAPLRLRRDLLDPQHRDEEKPVASDLIQIVLREWLETNAYLPVRIIDEETGTGHEVL